MLYIALLTNAQVSRAQPQIMNEDPPGIDTSGPALVYIQVADRLAARIGSGQLVPGSRLPAERNLAAEYGVAYDTIRRGHGTAARTRPHRHSANGHGTFVAGSTSRHAPRRGWLPRAAAGVAGFRSSWPQWARSYAAGWKGLSSCPGGWVGELDGSAGRVFAGQQLEELVGGQGAEFSGAPLGDDVDGYLLRGQLLGVVDQFAGSAPLVDAVGQIEHGQRG